MTHVSMSLGVVAAAADVAGAGAAAAAAEDAAAAEEVALDVDAAVAVAETELADEPVAVVAHTHPPMDSFPAVAVEAARQTQAPCPTLVAVGFAVDPDSVQAEPHTRDTSRTAEAGRTDYAGVASGVGQVDASRRALAAHTAQAGVVGKVGEAVAILSVHGMMRNSRKGLAARELGVVRLGVGSRLGMMRMRLLWEGEEQGWRIVGAGAGARG